MNRHNYLLAGLCSLLAAGAMIGYGNVTPKPELYGPGHVSGPFHKSRVKPLRPRSGKIQSVERALPAARAAADGDVLLYGIVYTDYEYSLASFPAREDTEFTPIFTSFRLEASGGAVEYGGKLYVNYLSPSEFDVNATQYIFDISTGKLDGSRGILCQSAATVMAHDPVTDNVYGQFYDSDLNNLYWGKWDPNTGEASHIRKMDEHLYVLCFDSAGTAYAINGNGLLETLDTSDGTAIDKIGNTGIEPRYIQSGTIDLNTGRMFWAPYTDMDGALGLYEVDKATGKATRISEFEDYYTEIAYMYTVAPKAKDNAPAEVADLAVVFDKESLSGTASFTIPTLRFDGSQLEGDVEAIMETDDVPQSVTGKPGEKVSFNVSVPATGNHKFSAYCVQDGARSPRATLTPWVGEDAPSAVTDLTLVKDGNKATVTWKAPTIGTHGGYVDPERVTYSVGRQPNGPMVSDYTSTTFTEEIPDGAAANIHYVVTPYFKGLRGPGANSNSVRFGENNEAPWSYNFTTPSNLDLFTTLDANNDGVTWEWFYGGYLRYDASADGVGAADDWVFTPETHLLPGQLYYVTYNMAPRNGTFYPETFEVAAGNGTTPDAMTISVAKDQALEGMRVIDGYKDYTYSFSVPEEGQYSIGLHLTSPAGWTQTALSGVYLNVGESLTAPAACTGLSATPGAEGALNADVTFTTPSSSINGFRLRVISRVDILAGSEVVGTVSMPTPGAEYTVNVPAVQGNNDFTVIAYDMNGDKGLPASITVYVGEDTPAMPGNVHLDYDEASAVSTVTWTAPTVGENGGYINPANLKYAIYNSIYEDFIANGITDTSWQTTETINPREQEILYYGVFAYNEAGSSVGKVSNSILAGNNYTLPFSEPFPGGGLSYNMWIMVQDERADEFWTVAQNDGRNTPDGCSYFQGAPDGTQVLSTGKVDMTDAHNPQVSFWTRVNASNADEIAVCVAPDYQTDYTDIATFRISELQGDADGWCRLNVSLADYAGRDHILVGFRGISHNGRGVWIDDILIRDLAENDLKAGTLTATPKRTIAGTEPVDLLLEVENVGSTDVDASGYTVDFLKGDEVLATIAGCAVKAGEKGTVSTSFIPTINDPGTLTLSARINFAADAHPADNTSGTVAVRVEAPELPVITDLSGTVLDSGVTLAWSVPNLEEIPARVITDSFEDYEPFTIDDLGEWTLFDADGSATGGLSGRWFDHMYAPKAFQVIDQTLITPPMEVWKPRTGMQFLTTLVSEECANDDWLISPLLSGKAQTISLFAQSVVPDYGLEDFEIWISKEGTSIDDFEKLTDEALQAPAYNWTEFTFDLPEGTRHFAVRCVSDNKMCFMLDDITFEKAPVAIDVRLVGFNIYRDGVKIAELKPEELTFTDNAASDGSHVYSVRCLFDKGESADSNLFDTAQAAIEAVGAEDGDIEWYTPAGISTSPDARGIRIARGKKVIK